MGVIGGGPSVEHEISLQSAKNVFNVIDEKEYEKVFIGITKTKEWFFLDLEKFDKVFNFSCLFALDDHPEFLTKKCSFDTIKEEIDIAFPVLHGNLGEDGAIQGLFKCLDIPCVGPGLLDAALTMDKELLKRVVSQEGIAVAPYITLLESQQICSNHVEKLLGFPVFVKPANSGSSLGITKVKQKDNLGRALEEAFKYDSKVLIEKAITCREIECSVIGNIGIEVSCPGEVICHHEFYSYEAKYLDDHGASLSIPAGLPKEKIEEVKILAKKAYQAACCRGMARVDFFLDPQGVFFLNEINSIPGFTKISLYPKLWEHEGVSQKELVKKLIALGLENYQRENKLKHNFINNKVLV